MKEHKIGRYPEADIVLTLNFCSRNHALLTVVDSGKIILQDYSSNGTTVNGNKFHNQTTEIKYGDEVLFGGVEKLDWSKIEKPDAAQNIIQQPNAIIEFSKKHALKALAVVVFIGLMIVAFRSSNGKKEDAVLTPTEIYNRYKNAVAMVEVKYYIRIHTKANDIYFGLNSHDSIDFKQNRSDLKPLTSEGTAFFIDSSGILITNHHVVEPWAHDRELKDYFNARIKPAIKRALLEKGWGEDEPKFIGELDAIYIYVNGKTFSPANRIECSVHNVAANAEIDLASLKITSHQLPPNVSLISLDAREPDENKIQVGASAYVIGFPYGDVLALNENNQLNCTSTQGSFTQEPAQYYIQYSAQTASGGSGSPVFDQYGKLVAVTYQGSLSGQSFNRGILVKYLKNVR